MFEKFNGTPLYLTKLLTMQRMEYQVDGSLTQLARDVLGFGDAEELARRAEEAQRDAAGRGASARPRSSGAQSRSVSGPSSGAILRASATSCPSSPAAGCPVPRRRGDGNSVLRMLERRHRPE
jgi:hypothetical protein